MSVIQSTITLDNQMSGELERIKSDVENIIKLSDDVGKMFDNVSKNLEIADKYFGELDTKINAVKDNIKVVDEEFEKVSVIISEKVEENITIMNETLIETKEKVEEIAEASKEIDDNIGKTIKSTAGMTKGLNQISKSTSSILRQFKLIPPPTFGRDNWHTRINAWLDSRNSGGG